jgi:hypothetical protein
MGDLMRGRSAKVHLSEVAVMVFIFGRPRCFSFTLTEQSGYDRRRLRLR